MDIIKCNKCNQVLVSGNMALAMFGPGTSIECRQCGNKYTFGQEDKSTEIKEIV